MTFMEYLKKLEQEKIEMDLENKKVHPNGGYSYGGGLMGATQAHSSNSNIVHNLTDKLTLEKLEHMYKQIKRTGVSVDDSGNVSVSHDTAQNYDAVSLAVKHILIEPLFFNDFYVAVYDENNNLLLDKKYFTKSLLSAKITAYEISKEDFCKDFPIYICNKNIDGSINYEKIVLKYKNEHDSETTS